MTPNRPARGTRLPIVARRASAWTAGSIAVLLVGACAGWAVVTVFSAPEEVGAESEYITVELVEGEVGSSLRLNTSVEWKPTPAGTNQAIGVVTSVDAPASGSVAPGDRLYSVNLRPVVAAVGSVPSFRAMSVGTNGEDVRQLQQLLATLALYSGPIDGKFGAGTERAVKQWQKSLRLEQDGVVQSGDLVFLPALPSQIAVDPTLIARGATLSGGEQAISGLGVEPVFSIAATADQAERLPVGTVVEIPSADSQWRAEVTGSQPSTDGGNEVILSLAGIDGEGICGAHCASIPAGRKTLIPSRAITQETVVGVVVPSGALLSTSYERIQLVDSEGNAHEVQVIAAAGGMSVVDGVPAGLRVRMPPAENAGE